MQFPKQENQTEQIKPLLQKYETLSPEPDIATLTFYSDGEVVLSTMGAGEIERFGTLGLALVYLWNATASEQEKSEVKSLGTLLELIGEFAYLYDDNPNGEGLANIGRSLKLQVKLPKEEAPETNPF